jgi:hypothetical protein
LEREFGMTAIANGLTPRGFILRRTSPTFSDTRNAPHGTALMKIR